MTRSPHRRTRRIGALLVSLVLAVTGALVTAPTARADTPYGHPMPAGNWTFVRADIFLHYACKVPMSGGYGPVYRVHTLTWYNGHHDAVDQGIGVYAVVTRFSNGNVVDSKTNPGWFYGFNGNELWASAWYADRLWMSGAYYGPVSPWTNGYPVRWLTNC